MHGCNTSEMCLHWQRSVSYYCSNNCSFQSHINEKHVGNSLKQVMMKAWVIEAGALHFSLGCIHST